MTRHPPPQPGHKGEVSDALRQRDARSAWAAVRRQLRWQRRIVAAEHGAPLPGLNAIALGRALEALAWQEHPRALRSITRLAHRAVRTLHPLAPRVNPYSLMDQG